MTDPDKDKPSFSDRKYRKPLIVSFLAVALILTAALRLCGIDLSNLLDPATYVQGILFALGSIPLIFLIARRVFGSTVGGVAVLMLSLHGFHISLGQTASDNSAGTFLSLSATWLLLVLVRARTPRPWVEAGYIASVIVGALTVTLFWALIVVHVIWVILVLPRPHTPTEGWIRQIGISKAPRLIQTQTIALILAAPSFSQTAYSVRNAVTQGPTGASLMEYFSFGFLFGKDDFTILAHHIGAIWTWFLLAFALLLLVSGLRAPKREAPMFAVSKPPPLWLPIIAAVASAGVMLWEASIAHQRNEAQMALAAVPFLALTLPILATIWRTQVARLSSRSLYFLQERALLLWLLAAVAPLILFAASFKILIFAPRALTILTPYLLILCAAGAVWMFRCRTRRWSVISLTILIFAATVPYSARKASEEIPLINNSRPGALDE